MSRMSRRRSVSLNVADMREVLVYLQSSYRNGMRPSRGVTTLHRTIAAAVARSAEVDDADMRQRRLTEEQRRKIRFLRKEGYLHREIAKELGISKSAVQVTLAVEMTKREAAE